MDQEIIIDAIKHNTAQQSRIADALEEVLLMINNRPMSRLWRSSDRWSFAGCAGFPDQEARPVI